MSGTQNNDPISLIRLFHEGVVFLVHILQRDRGRDSQANFQTVRLFTIENQLFGW